MASSPKMCVPFEKKRVKKPSFAFDDSHVSIVLRQHFIDEGILRANETWKAASTSPIVAGGGCGSDATTELLSLGQEQKGPSLLHQHGK